VGYRKSVLQAGTQDVNPRQTILNKARITIALISRSLTGFFDIYFAQTQVLLFLIFTEIRLVGNQAMFHVKQIDNNGIRLSVFR
jgi:hypothetical protein